MFVQAFIMVVLRSHFTVDMISGLVFAHYLFVMAERHSYLIDWHIMGIPLDKRMAIPGEDSRDKNS
jgi:hypothetical protein